MSDDEQPILNLKSYKDLSEQQKGLALLLVGLLLLFIGIAIGYDIARGFCDQVIQNMTTIK